MVQRSDTVVAENSSTGLAGTEVRRPIEDLDTNPHLFRVTVRLMCNSRLAFDVTIAKDQEYANTPFTSDTASFSWQPHYYWFAHEVMLLDSGQWQLMSEGTDNKPYPTAIEAFDTAVTKILSRTSCSLDA
ncbi:MAG TPA: hypothetical protein VFS96_05165 [Nitrolancea sp.]|nr:hypothetical protein [Nitrolancea sp.]